MTREALIFQKLLKVVWHSDHIELDYSIFQMYSRWMNVPKNHVLIMNMANSVTQLSENRNSLMEIKRPLAEAFPR